MNLIGFGKKSSKKRRNSKISAPKATYSFRRNLLPPLIGLMVMAVFFLGLNAQLIAARLKYHFSKPISSAKVEAVTQEAVARKPDPSAPSTITIPRIGLSAPIIYENSTSEWAVQRALSEGVDHYGGTANPGQAGNTVIFGHSSEAIWSSGKYKYAFSLLDQVKPGDKIIISYEGLNYIYNVTSSEIILPTNLSILNQNRSTPNLTLVTCSPIGTNRYRLVVHAVQTNPAPKVSKPAVQTPVQAEAVLPH